MHTRAKGKQSEDRVAGWLTGKGFEIVERNFQTRHGEIDLIARAPEGTLVFIEVKSARDNRFGHPFLRIDSRKQRRIVTMARWYLAKSKNLNRPCRFDAVAVMGDRIEHLQNAFLA